MATILVVDDDPDVVNLVAATLRGRGHDVLTASTGREALAILERVIPDLAVLDINMPDVDGLHLARTLRERPQTANVPILLLTALADEASVLSGFASGADDYVTKPFSPRLLAARVAALLARAGGPQAPRPRPQGRLVAVAGPKGGVGRTTVAANLAVAACQQRLGRTLLIECSLALGDLAVHLDVRSGRGWGDLLGHPGGLDAAAIESALARHGSGVEVLLRPFEPRGRTRVEPSLAREVLELCATVADLVVLDLEARYDEEPSASALDLANDVLLVVTPEIGSLRNARAFLEGREGLGKSPAGVLVVLNRAHPRAGIGAEEVADALGARVGVEIPDLGPAATAQVNLGTPFVLADPRCELARRIQQLLATLRQAPARR